MHERHASDLYRTKKDIAILTLLKVRKQKTIISATEMSLTW
jgi:hypothetical protein